MENRVVDAMALKAAPGLRPVVNLNSPTVTTLATARRMRKECNCLLPLKKALINGMHELQRALPYVGGDDEVDDRVLRSHRLERSRKTDEAQPR
ncbi:hypothetical protein B7463_g9700, partial [Scytalidium lignicola]